ncbi:MAG TPA: hypothetical protein VGQ83_04515 [Polyangia bacterium]|jgi:hypothetical protein
MRLARLVGIVAALGGLALASPVSAADTYCGWTPAGWNVPKGAAAFSSSPGPIKAVIQAIGEYRSHSVLSNGPGWFVTHATAHTPETNGDLSPYWTPFCSSCGSECWNPLDPNQLRHQRPGMEQVENGAMYAYYYGDFGGTGAWGANPSTTVGYETSAGNLLFLAYQNGGTQAANVANYSWYGDSTIGFAYAGYGGVTSYSVTYNGGAMNYGWAQYMNSLGAAQGYPGYDLGIVCSSALAFWQHRANVGVADVLPRRYSRGWGYQQIGSAASALYNTVYNECYAGNGPFASIGSFFQYLGYGALCVGYGDGNPCDEVADQMVNCFATGHCGDTSDPGKYNEYEWQWVVGTQDAVTISPDDVSCWHGNGTGAPCTGYGSSIWGYDINQPVQWNSGGSNYSCWD